MNYTSIKKKKKSLNEAALKRGKNLKYPGKQCEHRFRRQLRDIFYKVTQDQAYKGILNISTFNTKYQFTNNITFIPLLK